MQRNYRRTIFLIFLISRLRSVFIKIIRIVRINLLLARARMQNFTKYLQLGVSRSIVPKDIFLPREMEL